MSTELAKVKKFPLIANEDTQKTFELFKENLGAGERINLWDLDIINIPTGGITSFSVPTIDGVKMMDALEGVILGHKNSRSYWAIPFDEGAGGGPPDCASSDMERGVGNPGGECSICPMNQFGSAKGNSKACRQEKHLFLAMEDNTLPRIVKISPGSLASMKAYMGRLASEGLAHYSVLTRLSLTKDKNRQNITFSKIEAKMAGVLPPEVASKCKTLKEQVESVFTV
jgi:hypothetical protein